jgi:molybdopterin-guanine dinucleotide biosynthesis protein A
LRRAKRRIDHVNSELPAFGVCGWSGSGKTTLLVELVRHFTARKLKVAVIKHDVHGLDADREGKDSDRFFRAGADVVLTGPGESLCRGHLEESDALRVAVNRLYPEHDLVLVEGNKTADLARKVWLLKDVAETPPPEVRGIARVLTPNENRLGVVTALVEEWLRHVTETTPVCAGILFGGRSRRMGQPKHLLRIGNRTWLEHIVATLRPLIPQAVLLGAGEVPPGLRGMPVLPDAPDKAGPLAGMLAAMRWRPDASWVFVACDLPRISLAAVEWLLSKRAAGVWAILPQLPDGHRVEPLFACYESQARLRLEDSRAPSDLARLSGVITPEPPPEIAGAWANMNTPMDVAYLQRPVRGGPDCKSSCSVSSCRQEPACSP